MPESTISRRPLQRSDRGGFSVWSGGDGEVEVRFVGRGPESRDRQRIWEAVEGDDRTVTWLDQVHGADVRVAGTGGSGEGDAIVTDRAGLVLSLSTADCVPVVIFCDGGLAVAHAGWRGLVAGVVPSALSHLGAGTARAWIGPAIGPCCYEVGRDVARAVVAVSDRSIVRTGSGRRPRIDLVAAVSRQLAVAGITDVEAVSTCTRCEPDTLWSFRREGAEAGRNLCFAWRHTVAD